MNNWTASDPASWLDIDFEDGIKPPPIPQDEPECDCGAKHTQFPNHHSYWCSVEEWKMQREADSVADRTFRD